MEDDQKMTTTAKDMLDPAEVSELEAKIEGGSVESINDYFDDAIEHHINEPDELEKRKRIIRNHCAGEIGGWERFGILSALTNDRDGWDAAVRVLDDEMPASMGVTAAQLQHKYRPELASSPQWSVLLESSVALGHLGAKMVVFRRKTDKLGIFQGPVLWLYRMLQVFRAVPIALRNPSDSRLPRKR